jgi:hypothetical protein
VEREEGKMVTILMAYVSGVKKMLDVTMTALARHDAGYPFRVGLVVDESDTMALTECFDWVGTADVRAYDVGTAKTGSGQHGRLLDRALKDVDTEFFLTMDSDCFPVADGWLKKLVDMQADDVAASGILWPWIPPPDTVEHNTIEWRIRKYHCWKNTHPACQLIRTKLMKDNGWMFADPDGDDTNHGFMEKAYAAGMKVVGLMPTRGPFPDEEFDPEMNRYESLVFGDMIYHHVGASRECRAGMAGKAQIFKTARERVYNEVGAEWMLIPGSSHAFKMDREEEVAQFKMRMLYRTATQFLETRNGLFSNNWA